MTSEQVQQEIYSFIGEHYPAGVIAQVEGRFKALTVSYCDTVKHVDGRIYAEADTIEELAEKLRLLRGPIVKLALKQGMSEAVRN